MCAKKLFAESEKAVEGSVSCCIKNKMFVKSNTMYVFTFLPTLIHLKEII